MLHTFQYSPTRKDGVREREYMDAQEVERFAAQTANFQVAYVQDATAMDLAPSTSTHVQAEAAMRQRARENNAEDRQFVESMRVVVDSSGDVAVSMGELHPKRGRLGFVRPAAATRTTTSTGPS